MAKRIKKPSGKQSALGTAKFSTGGGSGLRIAGKALKAAGQKSARQLAAAVLKKRLTKSLVSKTLQRRNVSLFRPSAALFLTSGLEGFVRESAALQLRVTELARDVVFTVATPTRSGIPIQSMRGRLTGVKLDEVRPTEEGRDAAVQTLTRLGFTVLNRGRFGLTAKGPADLVSETLGQPLALARTAPAMTIRSLQMFGADDISTPMPDQLFLVPMESLSVAPLVKDAGDHFVFTPPAIAYQIAASGPKVAYPTLDAPTVRKLLKADRVGCTGSGVKIGMVDSGFDLSHPYYAASKPDVAVRNVSGAPPSDRDAEGHGTAQLWNLHVVAPGASIVGVGHAQNRHRDAIELAAGEGADIITCSWGWKDEQTFPVLEATIQELVNEGKILIFSAGNGVQAWPASMPEVIAVGGVHADAHGSLEASDFSSGFMSSAYPGRRVPDVSGLCGPGPSGVYLPLPCPAGCTFDVRQSGPGYPERDTTRADDGWVYASGTSSAAPQVAACLGLLMEKTKAKGTPLTPAMARQLLTQSATPVTKGRNAMGHPAEGHPNLACGYGLVDTEQLFAVARQKGYI